MDETLIHLLIVLFALLFFFICLLGALFWNFKFRKHGRRPKAHFQARWNNMERGSHNSEQQQGVAYTPGNRDAATGGGSRSTSVIGGDDDKMTDVDVEVASIGGPSDYDPDARIVDEFGRTPEVYSDRGTGTGSGKSTWRGDDYDGPVSYLGGWFGLDPPKDTTIINEPSSAHQPVSTLDDIPMSQKTSDAAARSAAVPLTSGKADEDDEDDLDSGARRAER